MEVKTDKINTALEIMNEDYWNWIARQISSLSEQSEQLTKEIAATFSKLVTAQVLYLESKYKGYQRLAENKKKSAVAKIVSDNKDQINQHLHEKHQIMNALTELLTGFNAIIEESHTLGEVTRQKGGGANG